MTMLFLSLWVSMFVFASASAFISYIAISNAIVDISLYL